MRDDNNLPLRGMDEGEVLAQILAGTASQTGTAFFGALVEGLARALQTHLAWVTEYIPEQDALKVLSHWSADGSKFASIYPLVGTPCEPVVRDKCLVHVPDHFANEYPQDLGLIRLGVTSYLGVPLVNGGGEVLGHLAVMDAMAMPEEPKFLAVFRMFAARAAAELQRLRVESDLKEREEKLTRLLEGTMDAIVELDEELRICNVNHAASALLGIAVTEEKTQLLPDLLDRSSKQTFLALAKSLQTAPSSAWVPDGLVIMQDADKQVPVEATCSSFRVRENIHYVLVMRDLQEKIAAEKQIRSLHDTASYLQDEIRELTGYSGIVGSSKSMQKVFADIESVATTNATVLITGATGTGKELVARAVHEHSQRANKVLIKLNCAALPTELVEAELFGHAKGAFTGAATHRDGRFTVADGGTIFLDEVGDLPLDLQPKLLRVLQEGEFEPVGSSTTVKVDVRVITATNQQLEEAVREGRFREDLYYRLAVFPIELPPLRDRLEDLPELAYSTVLKYSERTPGPRIELTDSDLQRLSAYDWPGNVRELQNVIERASITAVDGRLNLDRALPTSTHAQTNRTIETMADLVELERQTIEAALHDCNGQVSGKGGAAAKLGLNPSTLGSRMKALGIKKSG